MKTKARFVLVLALILCIISSVGASLFQTDFGAIEYHDLTIDADSGHKLDALLLVPKTATENSKAPAIVVSHGWYNNREMQDLNYVEYARRGYVVLAISMYGHGDSEVIESNTWWDDENNANGLYDGVKYVSRLPYVDANRIGVTGHSNGALACREAVLQDEEGLIAAALLVSNDAVYYDDEGNFYNQFGSRDAAIIACQYDEFFHRVNGNPPREYINQATAQSFLYHGEDPTGLEHRVAGKFYSKIINEEEAIRGIFNPPIIHPWAHFSTECVAYGAEFFNLALGAPNPLAGSDQIWTIKAFFNALGVVGFFMFAGSLAIVLLNLRIFRPLQAEEGFVAPWPALEGDAKKRYWRTNIWSALWSMPLYFIAFLIGFVGAMAIGPMLGLQLQGATCVIGAWSLFCGLRAISVMKKSNRTVKSKDEADSTSHTIDIIDKEARGIKLGKGKMWRTILLSVIVVAASYGLVYLSDFLLLTDYRLWCFATIRAFSMSHLPNILLYLPLWLMYYIPVSVAGNCYNYTARGRKGKRGGLGWQMFFAALGPVIMTVLQYGKFYITGKLILDPLTGISGIWLFPIIVILPVAALISRVIYRRTKNPYIGGIIMALLACIMTVTNTLTG